MIMKRAAFLMALWVVSVAPIAAQQMKVVSGDFDFLRGQEAIAVKFDFSEVKFYNENLSEQEYIDKRIAEIEEKEPGESANWVKDWEDFRDNRFFG